MTNLLKIERLTSRPQFLAAAKGVSQARGAVVVQRLDRGDADPVVRVGFTATRKVGGAVVRNRAKRRLREAARALIPAHGAAGSDYVLIARMGTVARPWDRLLDDVKSALTRLATSTAASQTAAPTPISGAMPASAPPPAPARTTDPHEIR
jgi:ribonuclease P protein component